MSCREHTLAIKVLIYLRACCCTKRCNNTEDQNDNIIFVIKSLDDDRIASIEMFTKGCKKYLI